MWACCCADYLDEEVPEDRPTGARQQQRYEEPEAEYDEDEEDDEMAGFIDDDTGDPGQPRRQRRRRPSGAPAGVSISALNVSSAVACMRSHGLVYRPGCVHVHATACVLISALNVGSVATCMRPHGLVRVLVHLRGDGNACLVVHAHACAWACVYACTCACVGERACAYWHVRMHVHIYCIQSADKYSCVHARMLLRRAGCCTCHMSCYA